MSSLRLERVRELLKRELGEVIRREVPVSEAGLITVNDVLVASDLHTATVYVGIMGNADQIKRGMDTLNNHRKRIQSIMARSVILKYTPQLRFELDQSAGKGDRVMRIIEDLEKDSNETPSENN
jgi:ribosome-binding factor A